MDNASRDRNQPRRTGRLALAIALGAAAGALGWGIRGQFGGEAGATVPGALFGLCIALLLPNGRRPANALMLGAVGALAFSMGGSMTYGQTLGHMHGMPNSPTYWWGVLGLVIKGGVWIGLGGLIVGMAAGGAPYSTTRLALILAGAVGMFLLGVWLLNSPHEPPDRLPGIYFSNPLDEPRREVWGGLLLGYLWLLGAAAVSRDRFALRLSLFGLIGGAIGFPAGEAIQAWAIHAKPLGREVQRWISWWKVMECCFGGAAGAMLAAATATWKRPPDEEDDAPPPRLGRVTPVAWLAIAWCALFVAMDLELLPLGMILGMPFLGVFVPLLCCFHEGLARQGRAASFAVLVGLVFVLSAANIAGKIGEHRLPGMPIAVALLALATVATLVLVARQSRERTASASWLISFVAISQTVLAGIKSLIVAPDWTTGLSKFVSGAALTVEIIFVLLAIAVVLLARAAGAEHTPLEHRERELDQ